MRMVLAAFSAPWGYDVPRDHFHEHPNVSMIIPVMFTIIPSMFVF